MISEEERGAFSLFRVSIARSTQRLGIRICERDEENEPWEVLDNRGAFLLVRGIGAQALLVSFDSFLLRTR